MCVCVCVCVCESDIIRPLLDVAHQSKYNCVYATMTTARTAQMRRETPPPGCTTETHHCGTNRTSVTGPQTTSHTPHTHTQQNTRRTRQHAAHTQTKPAPQATHRHVAHTTVHTAHTTHQPRQRHDAHRYAATHSTGDTTRGGGGHVSRTTPARRARDDLTRE